MTTDEWTEVPARNKKTRASKKSAPPTNMNSAPPRKSPRNATVALSATSVAAGLPQEAAQTSMAPSSTTEPPTNIVFNSSNEVLQVSPAPKSTTTEIEGISNMFNHYANDPADNLPGKIGPNGVFRLLEDVKVKPSDCAVLIFAWKLKAQTQCEFSEEEWSAGLKAIKCNSLTALRKWFQKARRLIENPVEFKDFYKFTYTYAKSLASRNLSLEVAVAYWQIIYGSDARVAHWIKWLEEQGRGVTRDEWMSFCEFMQTIKPDLSNYDETNAWPSRIDDYVDYCKAGK